MTEAEWLAATDPTPMLEFLRDKVSHRKLRLFACAWGWDVWPRMSDKRSQQALLTAEKYADGFADLPALRAASEAAWAARRDGNTWATQAALTASYEGYDTDRALSQIKYEMGGVSQRECTLTDRVRCLFGNPFRPVTVDTSCFTSTVVALARGIYDERAYDRMPILADALEDSGCDSDEILTHCREDQPHVRGCWVVDLVLGKN